MRAVVDIGSNSMKFVIADPLGNALNIKLQRSWMNRLGQGMSQNGNTFTTQALLRSEEALHEIRELLESQGQPIPILVVATAATRNAKDPKALFDLVKKYLGVKTHILSGAEEAEWSMLGAERAAKENFPASDFIFFDVGGASTEIGFRSPVKKAHSFDVGAVRAHESLQLQKSPIEDTRWEEARKNILSFFPEAPLKMLRESYDPTKYRAVAVGGTLLLATRLAGKTQILDGGSLISLAALEELNEKLRSLSIPERNAIPGMEIERSDIIVAGILALCTALKLMQQEEVFVTKFGLRHGLLYRPDGFEVGKF